VGFLTDIIHYQFYRSAKADHHPNIPEASPRRRLYEPEAKTHFSNIPSFQHSYWGEVPNLYSTIHFGKK
jgi:hypothetical protein